MSELDEGNIDTSNDSWASYRILFER